MQITVTDIPLRHQPFHGIGAEADCFIFDTANRQCGVNDADLAMIERRLRAVQPAVTRLFTEVNWVNPSLDGAIFDWSGEMYGHLLRQLRLLEAVGARANLVLFQPIPSKTADLSALVRGIVGLLEHLVEAEALTNIGWLTLYNEPDGLFPHDSPLTRAIFGEERIAQRPPFSEYVRINREAQALLQERGLYPAIRLLVADTVWGHPMRVERMRLCADAFADLDVDFSYHNYSAEDPQFYDGNPHFVYPGMAEEARLFREILGEGRELMLWEFNNVGPNFGSHYPGVGPHGVDLLGSLTSGVQVSDKVLTLAGQGVSALCLWCLHDVLYPYPGLPHQPPMPFGLWRYKWEGWHPRPYYHYYALLCNAFRPGARILRTEGATPGVTALAADDGGARIVALLNTGDRQAEITVNGLPAGPLTRTHVCPELIPAEGDLPVAETETLAAGGPVGIRLRVGELCVIEGKTETENGVR